MAPTGKLANSPQACSTRQLRWLLAAAAVAALGAAAVVPVVHAAPPAAAPAPNATPAPAAKPVTLQSVHDAVARDLWSIADLVALQPTMAQRLGKMNSMLRKRAYFERVPAAPLLPDLERLLRRTATRHAIELHQVEAQPSLAGPACPKTIAADARWAPSMDQLFGRIDLRLHVQGSDALIAKFIDALPEQVNRLVVIAGRESVDGDRMVLLAEAWFERSCPAPEVRVQWPTLRERLVAGGWSPNSRELQDALDSPQGKALDQMIEGARAEVTKAAEVLKIEVDFPRWLARWRLFADRGEAAMAVRGRSVVGLP